MKKHLKKISKSKNKYDERARVCGLFFMLIVEEFGNTTIYRKQIVFNIVQYGKTEKTLKNKAFAKIKVSNFLYELSSSISFNNFFTKILNSSLF